MNAISPPARSRRPVPVAVEREPAGARGRPAGSRHAADDEQAADRREQVVGEVGDEVAPLVRIVDRADRPEEPRMVHSQLGRAWPAHRVRDRERNRPGRRDGERPAGDDRDVRAGHRADVGGARDEAAQRCACRRQAQACALARGVRPRLRPEVEEAIAHAVPVEAAGGPGEHGIDRGVVDVDRDERRLRGPHGDRRGSPSATPGVAMARSPPSSPMSSSSSRRSSASARESRARAAMCRVSIASGSSPSRISRSGSSGPAAEPERRGL